MKTPSYSHVAVASGARTIYLAGQVPADAEGRLVGGTDLEAQATQVMENIGTALAAAGASFADVVKITTYVVDYKPEHRALISAVRAKFFGDRAAPPASTLLGVAALASPDWLIEIEAVAVVG
nr:RidA family protein [Roseococcus sp. SDR]